MNSDDLSQKSDDELRELMRSSISNQYVPSSVYHRAKQELEFRSQKSNEPNLSQTAKAILTMLKKSRLGTDATGKYIAREVLEHNFGEKRIESLDAGLKELFEADFIEQLEGYKDVYKLTPYGDDYSSQSATSTIYSNISNSNISHQSSDISQSIVLNDLDQDIRQAVDEFDKAAHNKDSNGMKKAFGYIADKAVDVAIALGTGMLLR